LGALLVNPAVLASIAAYLTADDFFLVRHSYIWEALLRLSEQEINEIVGSGFRVMVISSGLTFLLLLSVGVWVSQSFTRPILKLDAVAQAVAAGDLKRRANLSHDDEIGRLGRSFDQATATIAHLLDQQARTAGERHAILQSMADGLLAVDVDERIIMINPVAAELLGQSAASLLSQPLLKLTNVEDTVLAIGLQQVVDQIRSELHDPDMDKTEEHISLGNRVVRLHSAPTMGSGNRLTGAVVVLQDITEAVEADRAKSTRGVSHPYPGLALTRSAFQLLRNQNDRCPRLLQKPAVPGVTEETELTRLRLLKGFNTRNISCVVTFHLYSSQHFQNRVHTKIDMHAGISICPSLNSIFFRPGKSQQSIRHNSQQLSNLTTFQLPERAPFALSCINASA